MGHHEQIVHHLEAFSQDLGQGEITATLNRSGDRKVRTVMDHMLEHVQAACVLNIAKREGLVKSAVNVTMTFVSIPPPVSPSRSSPTGYLLLFHGCSHSSKDFCYASPRCPGCVGLPEEVRFVAAGLSFGLHVIAISAINSRSGCWTSARRAAKRSMSSSSSSSSSSPILWNSEDHASVLHVLRLVGALDNSLPIVVMGASSGGAFASSLPAMLGPRLVGAIVQISASKVLGSYATKYAGGSLGEVSPLLRVVYSVMQRDSATTNGAQKDAIELALARGVRLQEKWTQDRPAWISDDGGVAFFSKASSVVEKFSFSERIPYFPLHVSELLAAALVQNKLTKENGKLQKDPRSARHWAALVKPILEQEARDSAKLAHGATPDELARMQNSLGDSLKPDKSAISEVMNVLYANHEFFADDAFAMLKFVLVRHDRTA